MLALTNDLKYLKVQKELTEKLGLAKVKEMLKEFVNSCYDSALEQKAEDYIVLGRTLAANPSSGLDVPFHSFYH